MKRRALEAEDLERRALGRRDDGKKERMQKKMEKLQYLAMIVILFFDFFNIFNIFLGCCEGE